VITWVVGRGGLLGQAIEGASHRTDGRNFAARHIPWTDAAAAGGTLAAEAARFHQEAEDGHWRVIWAAGAATTSTSVEDARAELAPLQALLEALRASPPRGSGRFFLASSAGGVFAGSHGAPFDAATPPIPLSPYGHLKLEQEALATRMLSSTCPVVVGRISNLYGPGQNLDKLQGLISRLVLAALTQQSINIFVPLDTIRDYIYADDAARQVLRLMELAGIDDGARVAVIGSGRPVTVGQLLQVARLVTRRRIPVGFGSHPSAASQAADLRVVPTLEPDRLTPLAVGVKAVAIDMLRRLQASAA